MDCEKFDRVLMELLYEELDELTRAAAARHAEQCSRCREIFGGLSATRELAVLPMVEPPDGFESRIMDAEAQVRKRMPARQRLARAVTILSGYAMRPQLAMAALAMLMLGSSLVLLRPQPGSYASNVEVTESGVPLKEDLVVVPISEEPVAIASTQVQPVVGAAGRVEPSRAQPERARVEPNPAESPLAAEAELDLARTKAEDDAFEAAMSAYRSGQLLTAQKRFDEIVEVGGKHASTAGLLAAQAMEKALGCSEALARFDAVAASQSGEVSHTAIWHSADCRKQMGQNRRAILDFEKLLLVPSYTQQARRALSELEAIAAAGPVLAEARKSRSAAKSAPSPSKPVAQAADVSTSPAESESKGPARRAARPTTAKSAKSKAKTPAAPTARKPAPTR